MGKIYPQCMTETKQSGAMEGGDIESESGGFKEEGPDRNGFSFEVSRKTMSRCLVLAFRKL